MMYSTTVQNTLYSRLQKNEKFWQMLEVSKSVLFTTSDPQICEFRTAQNNKSFVLLLCKVVEYFIIYL